MGYIIGSARIDERGKLSGGAAGDQKQGAVPDRKGEVSMQDFYMHKKGWVILRPRKAAHAVEIAKAMERACNNANLGYDQAGRLGVVKYGTGSSVRTECDCSSLVRQCVKEGTGTDPGNFTTADEVSKLLYTGLFNRIPCNEAADINVGDILVTKTKGHTAIVTATDTFPTLRKGDRGGYVKELQTLLNYSGVISVPLKIDGDFGPLTQISLIEFQKSRGIRADGIAGTQTWSELRR